MRRTRPRSAANRGKPASKVRTTPAMSENTWFGNSFSRSSAHTFSCGLSSGAQPGRRCRRMAESLRQSGSNRGNDDQAAGGGAGQPRLQERAFFLLGEEGLAASAPVASPVGPRRRVLAEGGLEARHARAAHAQNGGGHLRPLHEQRINPAWSCHAPAHTFSIRPPRIQKE